MSLPLGGDFNSIIERGEFEISAFELRENKDYILFAVAYTALVLGIETPQVYSLLILLVLLKLKSKFGNIFLILNIVFFIYLGITGYHRNYLSLLLLVWGFVVRNPLLIIMSVLAHKAAFFYFLILFFSKMFKNLIYSKKNSIKIFKVLIICSLFLLLTYLIYINNNYMGPFKHYFEHYTDNEADKSQGAAVRYFSTVVTVLLFYIFKNQRKFYFVEKNLLPIKETIELSMWLCLVLSFVMLNLDFTIATDRINLFTLILFSILASKLDNNRNNFYLFITVSPNVIATMVWLIYSEKAYHLWGGEYFNRLFE